MDLRGDFNVIGVSMAAGAAVLISIMLLMANRMVIGVDSRVVSLYMMSSATIVYIIVDLIFQEFPLPSSTTGIISFLGSGIFHSFAMIGMFVGIAKIGAVRTSFFINRRCRADCGAHSGGDVFWMGTDLGVDIDWGDTGGWSP